MKTTLNQIRKLHLNKASKASWKKLLLRHFGNTMPDDEPLEWQTVLGVIGFENTLRLIDELIDNNLFDRKKRMELGVLFSRQVFNLMPGGSGLALDVFEQYVKGEATDNDLGFATKSASAEAKKSFAFSFGEDAYSVMTAVTNAANAVCSIPVSVENAACMAAAAAASWASAHNPSCAYAIYNDSKVKTKANQIEILKQFL